MPNVNVELEDDLHTRLKHVSVDTKKDIKDLVVKAIEDLVDREEKKKK